MNDEGNNVRAKLVDTILRACDELNPTLKTPIDLSQGACTPLYGSQGSLDSLGLVSLVVAVEQAIQDEFDVGIALADERAMSRKNSPFKTVEALADYAHGLLTEAGAPSSPTSSQE